MWEVPWQIKLCSSLSVPGERLDVWEVFWEVKA